MGVHVFKEATVNEKGASQLKEKDHVLLAKIRDNMKSLEVREAMDLVFVPPVAQADETEKQNPQEMSLEECLFSPKYDEILYDCIKKEVVWANRSTDNATA